MKCACNTGTQLEFKQKYKKKIIQNPIDIWLGKIRSEKFKTKIKIDF